MVTPFLQKILIGAITFFAVIYFGYGLLNATPAEEVNLSNTELVGQNILSLTERLNAIVIDQSIFSSTLFTQLLDLSVPIAPEVQGRPNPFAPIGFEQMSQSAINNSSKNKKTP